MVRNDEDLSETDIRNPDSGMFTVRAADAGDGRPWLEKAAVCPILRQYRIVHLGVAQMRSPFEIVRTALGGSYFLSCFGGGGEVLINGRWEICRPGQAFLLSPGTLHAFRALDGGSWDFCWVRYLEEPGDEPIARAASPVLAKFSALPFFHAVSGLYQVSTDPGTKPWMVAPWVDLVHGSVRGFAHPGDLDPRLERLWSAVEADLSADWSTVAMAGIAHVSAKQLERLCRKDLGRTPRQHLIALRMHRAAELLGTTDETVEAIAAAVGYQNPFAFSGRFRKFSGWPPSRYPARQL